MKALLFLLMFGFCFTVLDADFNAERESATHRQYLSGRDPDDAVIWKFTIDKGRRAGEKAEIKVPSCWEIEGFGKYTYQSTDDKSIGTYHRTFHLDESISDQRVLLVFEAVTSQADVQINGQPAGLSHHGGFYRFSYDITDKVFFDRENVIQVRVHKYSDISGITRSEVGDYWHFGGIIRPVYLKYVPQTYIAWLGLNGDMNGDLKVAAHLENARAGDRIKAMVVDAEGNVLGAPLEKGIVSNTKVVQIQGAFKEARLWSHEHPNLYSCRVQLWRDGELIDTKIDRFGFRTFEVKPGKGFFLNGQRVLLKGAARHSAWPDTGRSVSIENNRQDVKLMKYTMNMNFVRCVHYPPDQDFLDFCDEIGLLASVELTGWDHPLPTDPGRQLVRELVQKAHNHPSVIMWQNGNHRGYNPELHDEFHVWDDQERPIVWNDIRRANKVPGIERLGDWAVDTRFYPDYETFSERLRGNVHVVCPMETLHALYDGGGGAGLSDYMALLRNSPVGGGIVIWAYADEAVRRSDRNNTLDTAGNRAPDGLVGPYRELEASALTAREEFCPIQVDLVNLPDNFSGQIPIRNEFYQSALDTITCQWQLISFDSSSDKAAAMVDFQGQVQGPLVEPGDRGELTIPLPKNWKDSHALRVHFFDGDKFKILTRTWPIQDIKKTIAEKFHLDGKVEVHDSKNLLIQSGGVIFSFDKESGRLIHAGSHPRATIVGSGPLFVGSRYSGDGRAFDYAEEIDPVFLPIEQQAQGREVWIDFKADSTGWAVELDVSGKYPMVNAESPNHDNYIRWTVLPESVLKLEYQLHFPEGEYGYAGLAFDIPIDSVIRKKWLGGGPYRVWKNRLSGVDYGLWQNEYNDSIPGQVWGFPSFQGNFKETRWLQLDTTKGSLVIGTDDVDRYVGVLAPKNGVNPRNAIWSYPENNGLYLFHYISPVGAKWRASIDSGPNGAPNRISEPLVGTMYLKYISVD